MLDQHDHAPTSLLTTETCTPFPAVTTATLTGRQGHPQHQGAIWAARHGVALTAHPGASCGIHAQTHTRARGEKAGSSCSQRKAHVPHIRAKIN